MHSFKTMAANPTIGDEPFGMAMELNTMAKPKILPDGGRRSLVARMLRRGVTPSVKDRGGAPRRRLGTSTIKALQTSPTPLDPIIPHSRSPPWRPNLRGTNASQACLGEQKRRHQPRAQWPTTPASPTADVFPASSTVFYQAA
jgi:hypothetical protein